MMTCCLFELEKEKYKKEFLSKLKLGPYPKFEEDMEKQKDVGRNEDYNSQISQLGR